MAKAKKEKESDLKEKCPKCGSQEFAMDKGIGSKRYCQSCHNVWLPMSKEEIENVYLKEEVLKLRAIITELESKNVSADTEELFL